MSHLIVWIFVNALGVVCWSLDKQSTSGELLAAFAVSAACMNFHYMLGKLLRTTNEAEGPTT